MKRKGITFVTTPSIEFKCDCSCGQKLKVVKICFKKKGQIELLDVGVMKPREKIPKVGVVLNRKQIEKLIKFVK